MDYQKFKEILSKDRTDRYLQVCKNNEVRAVELYKYNIQLSEKMFSLISIFEVALRNRINNVASMIMGGDWIINSVMKDGMYYSKCFEDTFYVIKAGVGRMTGSGKNIYKPSDLVAHLELGFWKYFFAPVNYFAICWKVAECICEAIKSAPRLIDGAKDPDFDFNILIKEINSLLESEDWTPCYGVRETDNCGGHELLRRMEEDWDEVGMTRFNNIPNNSKIRNEYIRKSLEGCSNSIIAIVKQHTFDEEVRNRFIDAVRDFDKKFIKLIFPKTSKTQWEIYERLDKINDLRNRIAHHDNVCCYKKETGDEINTLRIENNKTRIAEFFEFMGIDKDIEDLSKQPKNGIDIELRKIDKIKPDSMKQ